MTVVGATRVAAIDCGTNAIRLLIADVSSEGSLREIDRTMRIVRLGEGVDRTGLLAEAAMQRTFTACREFAQSIGDAGVSRIRFVATSAARDAGNAEAFASGVEGILGVRPEVVTGVEEARLSFAGAIAGLPGLKALTNERVLVVDIGGGSTEFVLGALGETPVAKSVDIGCVRLTERHLHTDPPTLHEVRAAEADIALALEAVSQSVPIRSAALLIGLAGSVTTVAAMALGLDRYDAESIHGARISVEDVDQVVGELVRMSRTERAALPFMHPGRVDVIGGGALILAACMHASGMREVTASESDLLDGVALALGSE